MENLNYKCPRCKTTEMPRKKYIGKYGDKEIFICDKCFHNFEDYELYVSQKSDFTDLMVAKLEKQYKNKEISIEELENKIKEVFSL